MNHAKLLHRFMDGVLATLLLAGCGTPVITPTPIVIVVTATLQPASITPSVAATQNLLRDISTPSLTPTPSVVITQMPCQEAPAPLSLPTYVVTTKAGVEIKTTDLALLGTDDPTVTTPGGIPISNGVIVSFFYYVSSVEFDDEFGSVDIILVDGTVLRDSLHLTVHPYSELIGTTELGDFRVNLADVKSIAVQRECLPLVPQIPPTPWFVPNVIAIVHYPNGNSVKITDLRFSYHCTTSDGVFRYIHSDYFAYLPILEGIQGNFLRIREVEFLHEESRDNRLPMKVITQAGQEVFYHTQPPSPCEQSTWWLMGEAAWGDFGNWITAIKIITFEAYGN